MHRLEIGKLCHKQRHLLTPETVIQRLQRGKPYQRCILCLREGHKRYRERWLRKDRT